jgi:hypothetical protein
MNFFTRLEDKQAQSPLERQQHEAENQRVLSALAQYGRLPLAQFTRKGLLAAVVRLETTAKTIRRVGGDDEGQGAYFEVVS